MIWNGFSDDLGLSDFGALYWEEGKGDHTLPSHLYLKQKPQKSITRNTKKINKQVRKIMISF